MSELEMCANCDQPTGKAGRHEDSLYLDNWAGPLCETCYEEAIPELALAYGSVKSELSRLRERARELEGALIEIRNGAIWCKENAHDNRLEAYIETCDKALLSTGRDEG